MEKRCEFLSDSFSLEALMDISPGSKAVIITHPHPLMGGDMDNIVVDRIRQSYLKKGYTTLRFNFRGTGRSKGEFDNGIGEQNDIIAAWSFLSSHGYTDIDLAGYSFGAWVGLMTASRHTHFSRLVLVSPPVDYIEFEPVPGISNLHLVVTGSDDGYATPTHVKTLLKLWNPSAQFREIPGADHFYSGALEELGKICVDHL